MEHARPTTAAVVPDSIRPVVLSEVEQHVLNRQRDGLSAIERVAPARVSDYATTIDRVILATGCLGCIIAGALNPLLTASVVVMPETKTCR